MIKYINRIIFLAVVLSVTGCATFNSGTRTGASGDKPSLHELLGQLPAQSNVDHILLMRTILDFGQNGILDICGRLASGDTSEYVTSQYALSGLVHYVAAPGRDPERKMLISALHSALQTGLPDEQKAFLLSQLHNCAGEESVNAISRFLNHERLYEPATRALVAIGGPKAGEDLFKALDNASTLQKGAYIKALGESGYVKAADTILELVKDQELKEASLTALAQMGYPPAGSILKQAAIENNNYTETWLTFAEIRAAKGDISTCESICLDIIAEPFSDQYKIAALTLLVKIKGQGAFDRIVSQVSSGNNKTRIAALRLGEQFKGESFNQKWTQLLNSAKPEVQADIIDMLGRQDAESLIPVIREKLVSGPTIVRLAAIGAVTAMLGDAAANDLVNTLNIAEEDIERTTIKQKLLLLSNDSVIPVIQQRLPELSPDAKIVLLDILKERDVRDSVPLLLTQLDSEEKVRTAALEALAPLAGEDELPRLIDIYLKANGAEKRAAKKVVVAIVRNSDNNRSTVERLREKYNSASVEAKAELLDIFKSIGGNPLRQVVLIETTNEQLKDPAIRALTDWPDEGALNDLVHLAKTTKDTMVQILAIRGGMRLLRENVIGEPRAVSFCRQFMEAAVRPEEKKLILSQLANIKTPQALKYTVSFLNDTDLNFDASLAAVKIAAFDREHRENLSAEQAVLAMIRAGADDRLLAKLDSTPVITEREDRDRQGFTKLFNGKDLSGWKGLVADPVKRAHISPEELAREQAKADSIMRAHWHVVDGELYFDGHGASLCTVKDYANFEMWVDWKIEKAGDSGLYLRGSPQVQIWDPELWPEGSGGLYNNKNNPGKPIVKADNPVGQWNTFHIIMSGERVTVWLNDMLVVDNVILENYWERDKPIYPAGQIELQAHSSPLYFRNIYIRELPDTEPAFSGALFNGVDLTGWQVIGNKPDSWKVENGILYTNGGGGGWISTDKEYGNFKLELEFRVPPDGNSGVFIRAPRQGDPAYTGMEIQVLDDYAEMYAKLNKWQYTGSIYGVVAPSGRFSKPANEWQKMVIVCDGPNVTVNLNDHEIINANLIDHMDLENEHPGLKNRKGYIGLQNHSTRIEYRNIRIEELK
ncbi:DUF1080 domain-containing protein [candidate division KSB1 bacterium]|nr:DUF1080 domain-containing protein [candidate division KSB1 bacterium]